MSNKQEDDMSKQQIMDWFKELPDTPDTLGHKNVVQKRLHGVKKLYMQTRAKLIEQDRFEEIPAIERRVTMIDTLLDLVKDTPLAPEELVKGAMKPPPQAPGLEPYVAMTFPDGAKITISEDNLRHLGIMIPEILSVFGEE